METGNIPKNYFIATEILEVIDTDEYNALTASQQQSIQLILCTGHVNMKSGTKVKLQLFSIFGEGTNTRTALLALMS